MVSAKREGVREVRERGWRTVVRRSTAVVPARSERARWRAVRREVSVTFRRGRGRNEARSRCRGHRREGSHCEMTLEPGDDDSGRSRVGERVRARHRSRRSFASHRVCGPRDGQRCGETGGREGREARRRAVLSPCLDGIRSKPRFARRSIPPRSITLLWHTPREDGIRAELLPA